jgi:hypothetical protein
MIKKASNKNICLSQNNYKNETTTLQLLKNSSNYFWLHFEIHFRPQLVLSRPTYEYSEYTIVFHTI